MQKNKKLEKFFFWVGKHSILIALAIIFSFPFVWMISSSVKVDREMFSENRSLFPKAPEPKSASPYIDSETFPQPSRPADVELEHYSRLKKEFQRILRAAVENANLDIDEQQKSEAVDEVTEGLWKRLNALVPYSSWTNTALSPQHIARRVTTKNEILSAFNQCYRPFSLRLSRVRDENLKVYNLVLHQPITSQWRSLQPNSINLEEQTNSSLSYANVSYSFLNTNSVSLEAEFDLPFPASNFFQYGLGYRSDDSWHRMFLTIEGGGRKMTSSKPAFLLDYKWVAKQWQPESQQDKEPKIKLWTVLNIVDTGPEYDLGANKIRVTLQLKKSSKLQAWYGKLLRNYRNTFNYIPFWLYFRTSAFLVILNIIGTLFSSTLVAYAFARLKWPGREFCFIALLATLMIPPQVMMIPSFIIMKWFGWYNTLQPLWVFSFCGNAFYVFLLRQFMKGIPKDLEDAARIDGCGFFRIYWNVILPLVKPTMAAIAIFTFMGVWNDFMGPLIYLSDHRLYPLSLGLFSLNVQAGQFRGMMMASSFMMTLPVIIIFFFAQKYFIQGITLTGMKG